jgi:hypothetical protein
LRITVPLGNCSSRQPQKVVTRWWHRLCELLSGSLARPVDLRLGLLTPQPLPSSAPRIGEGEEHVFNYLLITRHPSEVELLCGIARPKHRYGSRVRHMNDGWPGRFREGCTTRLVLRDHLGHGHRVRRASGALRPARRVSTAAAIVAGCSLEEPRWHRQRWLRPECVETFALSRPQPPPEEYLNET